MRDLDRAASSSLMLTPRQGARVVRICDSKRKEVKPVENYENFEEEEKFEKKETFEKNEKLRKVCIRNLKV